MPGQNNNALQARDALLLALCVCAYAALLLFHLGAWTYPTQGYTVASETTEAFELRFGTPVHIAQVSLVDAEGKGTAMLEYWDGAQWQGFLPRKDYPLSLDGFWRVHEVKPVWQQPVQRLRLGLKGKGATINELAFFDAHGQRIPVRSISRFASSERIVYSPGSHALLDEQGKLAAHYGHMGNSYFDEIYHGRRAYELVHGRPPYELTHPTLGHQLIGLGIRAFDMTPFGMRISGVLAGCGMLVLMFVAGWMFTGQRRGAWLATAVWGLDWMPFALSRYATIDPFMGLFLLAMLLCLYRWIILRQQARNAEARFWLLGSGLLLGMAAACKWNALYVGLLILGCFFWSCWLDARRSSAHWPRLDGLVINLGRFALAFVLLPALVYYLSWHAWLHTLPDHPALWSVDALQHVVTRQEKMFHYHASLTDSHQYGSPWYSWPLIVQPLWLYVDNAIRPLRESMNLMGNPALWWTALLVLPAALLQAWRSHSRAWLFVLAALFSLWLPWLLIGRVTFIYHFYPVLPWFLLLLVMFMTRWQQHGPGRLAVWGLLALALGLSIWFYPAIAGIVMPEDYFKPLRWFTSWKRL